MPGSAKLTPVDRVQAKLWLQKWRWYERNALPWNRLAIHREMAARGAFARWPIQGNVLEMLREGRLKVGEGTLFEPQVWLTAPDQARIEIGTIKVVGARMLHNVIDRAIQAHGAKGLTDDTPLSFMYRSARFARIYDGPDEVHVHTVARRLLKQFRDGTGWDFSR